MRKLVGLVVFLTMTLSACAAQMRPHVEEPRDPTPGVLGCAPSTSIHDLIAALEVAPGPVDPRCELPATEL